MTENLFSYGTLQEERVQRKLFGRVLHGAKDALEGYMISTIEIRDEAFLAKGEEKFQKTLVPTGICGDFVEGTVFEITHDELLLSDKYEPNNYMRMKVSFQSGKVGWIYLARDSA